MLKNIHIRDFAIINELEVSLRSGMSVLTGETGAGKSILIDALSLALGDRADSSSVRNGCKRAEISAEFELTDIPAARTWLEENELDDEGQCLIRRTVSQQGPSKGFINGSPVPMQSLRSLGELLIDIHGQHAHQSLLRNNEQRRLLDEYADNQTLLTQLAGAYQQWRAAQDEFEQLQQAASDRSARLDLLRYQVKELDDVSPADGEMAQLDKDHSRLANVTRLQQTAQQLIDSLEDNEDHAASGQLAHAVHELESLREIDPQLGDISDSLNSALTELQDSVGVLRSYMDNLDADPAQFEEVESRLSTMMDLARKHHVDAAALPAHHQAMQKELNDLSNSESRLEGMQAEIEKLLEDYTALANKLSKRRIKAAKQLGKLVTEHMQSLGMPGGQFAINLNQAKSDQPSITGNERIEFVVSANPGQDCQALSKVASGGELSRISLAIQVVLAHNVQIPTLIFDEVDVGIGGGVAEIVGNQLRSLAKGRQVMCVTHLPQVAAQGHQHLKVAKSQAGAKTNTGITELSEQDRAQEIARMLGGVEITKNTLAHAEEMLALAAS